MVDETDIRALPRWMLPFAWCFAVGIWLAVLLMIFASDLTAQVARLARDAVARAPALTQNIVQREEPAEYVAQWDEPALAPVKPLIPPVPGNCDDARALGLAPAYEGQPGYAPWLDGDHDGNSCEPWRRHRVYLH